MSETSWRPSGSAVDRGEADPRVRGALASAYRDDTSYADAVAELCVARLILPTLPAPPDAEPGRSKRDGHDDHEHADGDHEHADHESRAAVLLRSASGAKGVLAFTGYDSLRAWRADAHPVRCTLDDVAATAVETEAASIVIDVGGPHPLVIEGELLDALAQGRRLARLPEGGYGLIWLAPPDGASGEA